MKMLQSVKIEMNLQEVCGDDAHLSGLEDLSNVFLFVNINKHSILGKCR